MEAVIKARAQQEEAKRAYDAEAAIAEEAYHDAIRRTIEKTEVLERHVKTVTMRADSLTTVEADFFQSLIERQDASPDPHSGESRDQYHQGAQYPVQSPLPTSLPSTLTRLQALHCPKLVQPQRES